MIEIEGDITVNVPIPYAHLQQLRGIAKATNYDIRTLIRVAVRYMLEDIASGVLPVMDAQPVTTIVDELQP